MIRLRSSVLLVALALAACDSIIDAELTLPPDAFQDEPLEVYQTWYAQAELCTGETGDFRRVHWFTVPYDRWWDPVWEQYAIGTWRAPHDIYLSVAHLDNEDLVKHEMVHDLLNGGHTYDPRFLECSGIAHAR